MARVRTAAQVPQITPAALQVNRASAEDAGAAIGRATSQAGETLERLGALSKALAEKRQKLADAAALGEASNNLELWHTRFKEENASQIGPGWEQTWSEAYEEKQAEIRSFLAEKGVSDEGMQKFDLLASTFQTDKTRQNIVMANNEHLKQISQTIENNIDQLANRVSADPGSMPSVMADAELQLGLLEGVEGATQSEIASIKERAMEKINLSYVTGLPPGEQLRLYENRADSEIDLPPEAWERVARSAEADIKRGESLTEEMEREIRAEVAKTGYDLLKDDAMTEEWVETNRDILSVSDYKTFLRATEPGGSRRKTEPREYLRLYDLAQEDPEAAQDELRDLYANDLIAKDDFKTLHNLAGRELASERGANYSNELRGHVKRMLAPSDGAPDSFYARQLDAMFAFDDWLEDHPNARREEMRKQADEIILDFKKIRYGSGVMELPLPRGVTGPRANVTEEELMQSQLKTIGLLRLGQIEAWEAARDAAIIRRWRAIIEGRE